MPYVNIEDARIAARKRRQRAREQKAREQTKAPAPYLHYVSTPNKRTKKQASAAEKGAAAGGRAAALKAYIPAPITLAPVGGPTLAEIEAKYGRL